MVNVILNGDAASVARAGSSIYWAPDRTDLTIASVAWPGSQNNVLAFQVAGSGPTDGFYRYQGAQLLDGPHNSTLDVTKGGEISYKFYIDPTWLIDGNKQASGVWAVMQNAASNAPGGGYYSIAEYVDPLQAAAIKAAPGAVMTEGLADFTGGFRFWNSEQGWTKYVNANATGWVDISFNMGAAGHAWSIKQGSAELATYVDSSSNSFQNAAKLQTLIVDSQNFGQNQSYFYDDIVFKGTTYSARGNELVSGALDGTYLWAGNGNQKTGFTTVDTAQVQLALSVRERLNPVSVEGELKSDGKVHFNYTPEHDQSRFAYSVATLGNVKLSDLDFKLQIDVNPTAAATYRTFLLRPDTTITGTQPSGFEWILDLDNNGSIDDADKFNGQFVIITDDEGNAAAGQVTQNIQNVAWYDDNLSSSVLTKGSYDIRLQAFDKGSTTIKAENHIVINVAGGATPVDNGGGNNGGGNNGGGGTTPTPNPNTPTPNPNAPTPFVPSTAADPSPNDGFNEAKAAASVATFFTGTAPSAAKQAELNAFANLQFEAYQKAGVLNPAMGPYEALGRGFSETVEFSQKYAALTEAEFITARYAEVFGRDPSVAQQAHFQAQIDYFELIYKNAGVSSAQADIFAKGAVLGQMIGHAALDPVTATTQASTAYAWDLAA